MQVFIKKISQEPMVPRGAILCITVIALLQLSKHDARLALVMAAATPILTLWSFRRQNRLIVSRRVMSRNLDLVSRYNSQLMEQLGELDLQTRQELGVWLHSTVQPKLLKIGRDAWALNSVEGQALAAEIDVLNEEVVRGYSHQLFPVQLEIALVLALADLLHNRAEFNFDTRMYPPMDTAPVRRNLLDFATHENALKPDQVFFPLKQRFAIYRIVEEAVANAEKKVSTTKIVVNVTIPHDQIVITVVDNGAPIADSVEPGLGYRLIDTYTLMHNGAWGFSNIAEGVQFRCVLPLASEVTE
jgi:glucose-6-phosphate-specific signal transduction histidine kinase